MNGTAHPYNRENYIMTDTQCKPVYEETFYIIPRHIRKLPKITLAYLDVYETIFQFWNKRLPCFLSNSKIQERTGLGHSVVGDAIKFFEENGELERKVKNGKRYFVQPMRYIETDYHTADAVPPIRDCGTPPTAAPVHNIKNNSNKEKETTTTCSSSFNSFEKECLELKLPSDHRTNEEFLENIYHHIKHNSDPESGEYQRQRMIIKLLTNLHSNAAHFKSKGYISNEKIKETAKQTQEQKEKLLWSSYQGYVKSPIEQRLREQGIAKLESFEEWKQKACIE